MTLSITTHYKECHYAECHDIFTVKLNMLNVVMLSVIMLNVVAPNDQYLSFKTLSKERKMEQHMFKLSLITEGASEKVLQLILLLKSIYNKKKLLF
jgi:hypothetical protein